MNWLPTAYHFHVGEHWSGQIIAIAATIFLPATAEFFRAIFWAISLKIANVIYRN